MKSYLLNPCSYWLECLFDNTQIISQITSALLVNLPQETIIHYINKLNEQLKADLYFPSKTDLINYLNKNDVYQIKFGETVATTLQEQDIDNFINYIRQARQVHDRLLEAKVALNEAKV